MPTIVPSTTIASLEVRLQVVHAQRRHRATELSNRQHGYTKVELLAILRRSMRIHALDVRSPRLEIINAIVDAEYPTLFLERQIARLKAHG